MFLATIIFSGNANATPGEQNCKIKTGISNNWSVHEGTQLHLLKWGHVIYVWHNVEETKNGQKVFKYHTTGWEDAFTVKLEAGPSGKTSAKPYIKVDCKKVEITEATTSTTGTPTTEQPTTEQPSTTGMTAGPTTYPSVTSVTTTQPVPETTNPLHADVTNVTPKIVESKPAKPAKTTPKLLG